MKYCNADPELWEPHHAGHQCWTVLVPMTEGRGAGTLSFIDWIFYNEAIQVRKLRENISDLKVQVSSITKGIPISQWDILAGR